MADAKCHPEMSPLEHAQLHAAEAQRKADRLDKTAMVFAAISIAFLLLGLVLRVIVMVTQ